MHIIRSITATLLIVVPVLLSAECAPDYRSDKKSGFLISELVISGTTSLDSSELASIRSKLTGACVGEDSDEIGERIRALLQNDGYMVAAVNNLHVKPTDPLAIPKPVLVEAEVTEGPRYKLATIEFIGNHAVSADALRDGFPMKKGDVFARDKVVSGLVSLRKLYLQRGFMDFVAMPDTTPISNSTMRLAVTVKEGTQYHMGELKIFAKKETADPLTVAWKLPQGAVFDATYVDKYVDDNHSLLPEGFTRSDIALVQDCPNGSIEVRLMSSQWGPAPPTQAHNIPCESSN